LVAKGPSGPFLHFWDFSKSSAIAPGVDKAG